MFGRSTQIGVEIVWENVDSVNELTNERMNESWDAYLASPADLAGADDIITKVNLAKERRPEIEIIERTPLPLVIPSTVKPG